VRSAEEAGIPVSDLGVLEPDPGLKILGLDGNPMAAERLGYDHFS
jgi:thiamine-monophosphate kinase